MQKIKLTVLSLFIMAGANAQGKIKLGLQLAGTAAVPVQNNVLITSSKPIVFAAPTIVSEFKLAKSLSFRPGIGLQRTGANSTTTTPFGLGTVDVNQILNINNLSIPLDLTIPIKMKENRFLINLGPSILYALGGKIKSTSTVTTGGVAGTPTVINGTPTFGNGATDLNPTNLSGKLGLGYQTKGGLEVNASYMLGLSELDNLSSVFKNNTVALGLAYFFLK